MQQNKVTKIYKKDIKSGRSFTRLVAVQSIFEFIFHEEVKDLFKISDEICKNYVFDFEDEFFSCKKNIDEAFLAQLLESFLKNLDDIRYYTKENILVNLKQELSDIEVTIIFLAINEIKFVNETAKKILISEYVDIAAAFLHPNKVSFMNAVLDKIA